MTHEISLVEDSMWNQLQEPARPCLYPAGYLLLLAALDAGWRVTEPICLRGHPEHDTTDSYLIVIKRRDSPIVWKIIIPETGPVERFIREEGWQVRNGGRAREPGAI